MWRELRKPWKYKVSLVSTVRVLKNLITEKSEALYITISLTTEYCRISVDYISRICSRLILILKFKIQLPEATPGLKK